MEKSWANCSTASESRSACPRAYLRTSPIKAGSLPSRALSYTPSTLWTFRRPARTASLPSSGACYRALRRLPAQHFHLLEERVFQDAPCSRFTRLAGACPKVRRRRRRRYPGTAIHAGDGKSRRGESALRECRFRQCARDRGRRFCRRGGWLKCDGQSR
jgi:hypothetical protein